MNPGLALAERGLLPDSLSRWGIRRMLRDRLREEQARFPRTPYLRSLTEGSVAPLPAKANEQHYEVPAAFFELVLGKRLKYSSAYWPEGVEDLDTAEEAMLDLYVERAQLADGQRLLELGCGWGSLTLHLARRFPAMRIVALSNSHAQREWIEARAPARVEVRTADMNDFEPGSRFDRIVSIEMFEHMRNYRELMRRVRSWLEPDGKLFVHVFCHNRFAYPFEADGHDDWMARHFFTGGQMPSWDLLTEFGACEERWRLSGLHYARTAEAWLARLDARAKEAKAILGQVYPDPARRLERWRLFFLACAELFAYRGGEEWLVAHYRFGR